jgi:H/ACA ribonucleoprotein complex subunit 2
MEVDYKSLAIIAKPLVTGKLHRRLLKLVRKSGKDKSLKRGVKEVVKAIRKNSKGYDLFLLMFLTLRIVIMAGDISPIDVLTHVPVLCEEAGIPYAFVPSKAELGAAGSTRRPTCCVLIPTPKSGSDLVKNFEKCAKEMKNLSS